MRSADRGFPRPCSERCCQPDSGGTTREGDDLDLPQRPGSDPGVQRLETGFFRGKARAQRVDPVNPIRAIRQLLRREDLVLNALEGAPPAFQVDDIDPHAENHAPLSPRPTVSAAAWRGDSWPRPGAP